MYVGRRDLSHVRRWSASSHLNYLVDQLDVRAHGFYDRLVISAGELTRSEYFLFSEVYGRSLGDTNMMMPRQLPVPMAHSITSVVAILASGNPSSLQFWQDYVLTIWLNNKYCYRRPLRRFPMLALTGVDLISEEQRTALVDTQEPWCDQLEIPIVITNLMCFYASLAGMPFGATESIDIMVMLNGLTAFPMC